MEATVGHAALGLHEEDTVDAFVAVQGHGGGVAEDGHALHFLDGETVDRPLIAVHEDEDVGLAGSLGAADVEARAAAFLTLETGVLEGVQAQELAIERIGQADGRGAAQLFGGDGIGRRRREEFRALDTEAQIHGLGLLVAQHDLSLGGHSGRTESQQADYKYIA